MLFWVFQQLAGVDNFFNVFGYITLRTILAALTALLALPFLISGEAHGGFNVQFDRKGEFRRANFHANGQLTDGEGFTSEVVLSGHYGTTNLRTRAEELGADLRINTEPQKVRSVIVELGIRNPIEDPDWNQ